MQKFLANLEVSRKAKRDASVQIVNYIVHSRLAASQSLWQTVTENVNMLKERRRWIICHSHNLEHIRNKSFFVFGLKHQNLRLCHCGSLSLSIFGFVTAHTK